MSVKQMRTVSISPRSDLARSSSTVRSPRRSTAETYRRRDFAPSPHTSVCAETGQRSSERFGSATAAMQVPAVAVFLLLRLAQVDVSLVDAVAARHRLALAASGVLGDGFAVTV